MPYWALIDTTLSTTVAGAAEAPVRSVERSRRKPFCTDQVWKARPAAGPRLNMRALLPVKVTSSAPVLKRDAMISTWFCPGEAGVTSPDTWLSAHFAPGVSGATAITSPGAKPNGARSISMLEPTV